MTEDRFKSPSRRCVDLVEDQSRLARAIRLKEGRCPLHDKPLLQCDVWKRTEKGRRYTSLACMHPRCRLEVTCTDTYDKYALAPEWKFVLEQDEQGCGTVLPIDFKEGGK